MIFLREVLLGDEKTNTSEPASRAAWVNSRLETRWT
jgi:hypothetical protein